MTVKSVAKLIVSAGALSTLVACGGFGRSSDADSYGTNSGSDLTNRAVPVQERETTIWDIFKSDDSDVTVKVNKYIWAASLEILDFLPVESVDPFSGVIVTGYGTPPGGGRAYRATVLVRDPALDARALHVALQTRGGRAVSESTVRAVEDAILARARQLRIRDGRF
ncbi:DUF3576 domain-containing protein [Cognatishimia sp. SS12]|uniref:DUF3576 domain-containing protein n=1 Tax=Cognatishimia sp. SS12 TaxID=2979465 RepID=UPI00232A8451|nr:DUF3576 domain-containing protein [Cognatishimia sp. SS12]MDC0737919.1 DUF3576 domain-containing protein [Cognatishimia sp. SS12]